MNVYKTLYLGRKHVLSILKLERVYCERFARRLRIRTTFRRLMVVEAIYWMTLFDGKVPENIWKLMRILEF